MLRNFERAEKIFNQGNGMLSYSEAVRNGINQNTLRRMEHAGKLERISRGLYRLPYMSPLIQEDLVIVSNKYKKAVICLTSALSFHSLTTQIPYQVYISLPQGTIKPKMEFPPLNVIWRSEMHYLSGIEEYVIENTLVKVYCIEKTIVDCFKFQKKVGKDVALEALRDYLARDNVNIPKLIKFAKEIRIDKIIMPYLEMNI